MTVATPATYRVRDGDKELEFEGWQLGHSSSQRTDKQRWSEIFIYRTVEGSYLVVGVGRSLVEKEQDRWWAAVLSNPDKVIERLHLKGEGGVRRLPFNNREALLQACRFDAALANAYAAC